MTPSTGGSGAASAAAGTMNAAAETARETGERLREQLGESERRVREIVDEYPLTCFLGAVVAGYLVGRIATRM